LTFIISTATTVAPSLVAADCSVLSLHVADKHTTAFALFDSIHALA
jgi:hypothetical protein